MKSLFIGLLLSLAILSASVASAQEKRVHVFDGAIVVYSQYNLELVMTPAAGGQFEVKGFAQHFQAGTPSASDRIPISGSLLASGVLRLNLLRPNVEPSPIDGMWDKEKQTLIITNYGGLKTSMQLYPRDINGIRSAPWFPKMGVYKDTGTDLSFTVSPSSNPNQATVSGSRKESDFEVRGTYYFNRGELSAFGEIRGREDLLAVTLDGPYGDDAFLIQYRSTRTSDGVTMVDEKRTFRYVGPATPDRKNDPPKDLPKGKLKGTLKIDPGAVEIGEKVKLTLNYSISERPEAEVTESVALYGPDGALITRSDKTRNATEAPIPRTFDIVCVKDGSYRINVFVKGEETEAWKDTTTFTVRKGKSTTPTDEEKGTYNLVKKVLGVAPEPYVDDQGWTRTAVVSEGSLKVTQVPHRAGVFQGFDFQLTWDNLPAVLKPGEIIELKCSANGTRSQREAPSLGASAWFSGGVEILSRASADIHFPVDNSFSSSNTGHFKFKVPAAGMRDFVIEQGYSGVTFGGTFNRPCTYTYKWNGEPITGAETETEKEKPKPTSTTMVQTSPDDAPRTLTARLETTSITLRAGEPSKIVNITIGGFRTNTSDRVEVVFPQATDGWASLPGQIVVGGGAGSYDPANMGRPEHADGYFFSARSTAPSGKTRIEIVVRQKDAGQVRLTLEVEVIGREPTTPDPDTGSDPCSSTRKNTPLLLLIARQPLAISRSANSKLPARRAH